MHVAELGPSLHCEPCAAKNLTWHLGGFLAHIGGTIIAKWAAAFAALRANEIATPHRAWLISL
jgi:hypothetical protein